MIYICTVPFLVRYSQFTGDQKYLDDAANQFFGFKETFVYAGRKDYVTRL